MLWSKALCMEMAAPFSLDAKRFSSNCFGPKRCAPKHFLAKRFHSKHFQPLLSALSQTTFIIRTNAVH
jgi:hypothetical protein